MGATQNKREYTRVATHIDAIVDCEGQKSVSCQVNNVSLTGVLLSESDGLSEGAACTVRLILGGIEPPIEIRAKGSIIRASADRCAIEFSSIDGDSYDHLRRLVLENAADTEAVETEFEESFGIRKHRDDF